MSFLLCCMFSLTRASHLFMFLSVLMPLVFSSSFVRSSSCQFMTYFFPQVTQPFVPVHHVQAFQVPFIASVFVHGCSQNISNVFGHVDDCGAAMHAMLVDDSHGLGDAGEGILWGAILPVEDCFLRLMDCKSLSPTNVNMSILSVDTAKQYKTWENQYKDNTCKVEFDMVWPCLTLWSYCARHIIQKQPCCSYMVKMHHAVTTRTVHLPHDFEEAIRETQVKQQDTLLTGNGSHSGILWRKLVHFHINSIVFKRPIPWWWIDFEFFVYVSCYRMSSPSTSCPNGAHQDIQIASLEQKTKTVTFKTELTGKSGIGVGMVKFPRECTS